MRTIPFRVLCISLQHLLNDRADWLRSKAGERTRRKPNPERVSAGAEAGRLEMADKARLAASHCGQIAHEAKDYSLVPIPAEVVGLILAKASGHDNVQADLREAIAEASSEARGALTLLSRGFAIPV